MRYRIFSDRLKLIDSNVVPKARFSRELGSIRNLHPSCPIWNRSEGSLRREWAAHNLANSLGIRMEKTKDCDLNFGQKWYVKLIYSIVGTIALWLIK